MLARCRPARGSRRCGRAQRIGRYEVKNMLQNLSLFPALSGLSLAGKAITLSPARRRSPTLSRRQLRQLIADMIG